LHWPGDWTIALTLRRGYGGRIPLAAVLTAYPVSQKENERIMPAQPAARFWMSGSSFLRRDILLYVPAAG
jgi:hypothetical protein